MLFWRQKVFFQFEVVINALFSFFCFVWIPMFSSYGSATIINIVILLAREPSFIRQILTYNDSPRAERVKCTNMYIISNWSETHCRPWRLETIYLYVRPSLYSVPVGTCSDLTLDMDIDTSAINWSKYFTRLKEVRRWGGGGIGGQLTLWTPTYSFLFLFTIQFEEKIRINISTFYQSNNCHDQGWYETSSLNVIIACGGVPFLL